MEVSGQLHDLAALPPEKDPRYPLDRWMGEPQSRSGHGVEEKNSQPPPGFEPRSSNRSARSQSLYRLRYLGSYGNDVKMTYEGVSKSFRTDRMERELQTVQLSATRCSCNATLWVSLVSSPAITHCVVSQRVFVVVVVVYFAIYLFRNRIRHMVNTDTKPRNNNRPHYKVR
jgi:hypothetical protein